MSNPRCTPVYPHLALHHCHRCFSFRGLRDMPNPSPKEAVIGVFATHGKLAHEVRVQACFAVGSTCT